MDIKLKYTNDFNFNKTMIKSLLKNIHNGDSKYYMYFKAYYILYNSILFYGKENVLTEENMEDIIELVIDIYLDTNESYIVIDNIIDVIFTNDYKLEQYLAGKMDIIDYTEFLKNFLINKYIYD